MEKKAGKFSRDFLLCHPDSLVRQQAQGLLQKSPRMDIGELTDSLGLDRDPREMFYTDLLCRRMIAGKDTLEVIQDDRYQYENGRLVMKEEGSGEPEITRFLYDEAGNLSRVLLPEDWSLLTQDTYILVTCNGSGLPEKISYMRDEYASSVVKISYTSFGKE
jgi:hypothetical protein